MKYNIRGVSSKKEDVHLAISKIDKGLFPGAFCKIVPDYLSGSKEHCLIMHADGAGTKSALAYLYWKETNDLSIWEGIAQDAIVMNIDDLLCIGAYDNFLISSTIGRNKNKIPAEVLSAIIQGFENVLEKFRSWNVNIINTGGETADVGDLVKTIIVDSTVITRIEKNKVINTQNISEEDYIVGLASYGKTTYETEYNSGIGSNGLTSARHDVLSSIYRNLYPETFDNNIDPKYIYSGKYKVTDESPIKGINIGKLLLSPTRTYLPVIREILKEHRKNINGIIHCTGGGQTKILNFINKNIKIVKNNLFPIPEVFKLIKNTTETPYEEMFSVFNMGHRMELYVSSLSVAEEIISIAKSFELDAKIIGKCEKSTKKSLIISGDFGELEYF